VKHVVGVADMKISPQSGDLIVTHALGSCLGLAAHDASAAVGGMLHVMMPTATANPEKAKANPWLFVDVAVPAFFAALEAAGASRRRCKLKVAGGAMVCGNDYFEIGKRNHIVLKKVLWKSGILIDAEDVGGNFARTMYMEIGSGRVWLSSGGKEWAL